MSKFFENEKTKVILFNLGALSGYVGKMLLLYHGIENIIHHKKVHFSIIGFIITIILAQLFTLPYKWDKYWIRFYALLSLGINFILLSMYLYTYFTF